MKVLLKALALLAALALPAAAHNPWELHIRHGFRETGVTMNYSVRWSFSDLKRPPRPSAGGELRDIIRSVRLDLYGVKVKPFRDLARAMPAASASAAAPVAAGAPARRARLELAPVVENLRRDARREAKTWLVTTLFDAAIPHASHAPRWQKHAVADDLVAAARVWTAD
ncbi:MAG: hypothetical protein HY553_05005 [Elusimicrobia bacterium]|nr:hypothetical protein [Elusimicrobiota bacterium]